MKEEDKEICGNCGHPKVLHKDYCIQCKLEESKDLCKEFKTTNEVKNKNGKTKE